MTDGMKRWVAAMRDEHYDEAWALCADSLAERDPATRDDPTLPYHLRWVWDGKPFDGKDVLVRCYHGLGDTIQFARYLPALAARVRRLTIEVPERLLSILRMTAPAGTKFVPFDRANPLPPAECDIEITELDFALHMRPEAVSSPYLKVAPAILPPRTIALCYCAGDWDNDRSVPSHLLDSICSLAPTLSLVSERTDLPVLNPRGCPFDMETTASLVAAVDLVITVDTMIAHLAGALGKPTWLMLKAEPDWRWNPRLTSTPWYPSMRLYVQTTPGDWRTVIARVGRDLAMRNILAAQR
jgi:hypothetical protein